MLGGCLSPKNKTKPNYVRTLEDEIEKQRQDMFEKLRQSGKTGTKRTETTFNEWLAAKREKRAEASRKLVEAEMRKKKGGKGLSVLSGRDLYTYNQSLFVDGDDDDAVKEKDEDESNVVAVATKLNSNLFLDGDDDDLDDLDDD